MSSFILLLLALSPLQAFNHANALYARKDYAGAIAGYEVALRAGHSARVHYNLGNALFKAGKIGQAILNYRRARYLDPRDPDIETNLAFARGYRLDKLPATTSPLARLLDDLFHRLSRREAAMLAALFFTLAAAALAIWIVRRWSWFAIAASVFATFALLCFVTQRVWTGEVNAAPAVVIVPEVEASSGPSEEFKQILQLHDGTEVRIRESRGDYFLVQLPGGAGGWIKKGAVERVF